MKVTNRHLVPILGILVIAVYYPAIFAPYNPMDDRALVTWLINLDPSTIVGDLFGFADIYYRPLLMGTFVLDWFLWGASSKAMHLENVLIHTFNAMLVYGITRQVCRKLDIGSLLPAFCAGLLFGLHPLTTEPVIWISGRSDLLAGTFFLLALLCFLSALARNSLLLCLLSYALIVPGVLCKETVVFMAPVALILAFCYDGRVPLQGRALRRWFTRRGWFWGIYLSAPVAYLVMRAVFVPEGDPGMRLLQTVFGRPLSAYPDLIKTVLVGSGFYLKKLVVPVPLNFTIFRVSEHYLWLGLCCVALIAWLCYRRDLVAALYLACAAVASSAIMALIVRPAWTPYAERYVYIPAALFVVAVVITVCRVWGRQPLGRAATAAVAILVAASAWVVVDRTLVWHDNIGLFRDAVAKSPDFPFARSTLAELLLEDNQVDEAYALIMGNEADPSLRNREFLELKRAEALFRQERYAEARDHLLQHRDARVPLYAEFQKALLIIDTAYLRQLSGPDAEVIAKEIQAVMLDLLDITGDPFYHYRLGQFLLQRGDKEGALTQFELVQEKAPEGVYYRQSAQQLAETLRDR